MRALVKLYCSGGATPPLLEEQLKDLVQTAVADAYFAGLQEGGVTPEEFTEDDAQQVDNLTYDQFAHIDGFIQAVQDGCEDMQGLLARADMWVQSINAAGQAGLNSAKANEMVTWHLGSTEQHCKTCARLNGQRHRRKWFTERDYIPGKPGAAMDCGGWNCDCELVALPGRLEASY